MSNPTPRVETILISLASGIIIDHRRRPAMYRCMAEHAVIAMASGKYNYTFMKNTLS
jgi:hypothetical protein